MSQSFTQALPVPLPVSKGGSGNVAATAYAVQCGGTTSTGNLQSIASVGTAGQVLTSNGAGALPTMKTLITDFVAYTPTFTGFGTAAVIQVWSRRVGDTLEVRGRFQSGTSTAVEARMTLGYAGTNNNINSSATKITAIQMAGPSTIDAAAAANYNMLIESNVAYMTFGLQNSARGGLTKVNGSTLVSSGNGIGFVAFVPIDTWP